MGLALVWKSAGKGSQDCLAEFKKGLGFAGNNRYGIGHTGTLDPFAEGLLCVGFDEGTKLLAPLSGLAKSYRVSLVFGASTDTLDLTGQFVWPEMPIDLNRLHVELSQKAAAFLESKLGSSLQTPPQFSAVHIDGKRAYEWARAGIEKEIQPREVVIEAVQHQDLQWQEFAGQKLLQWQFEVKVSAGTYIRAFARDWGQELCGFAGFLAKLVRTEVGPFRLEEAPEQPQNLQVNDLQSLFDLVSLDDGQAHALKSFGRWLPLPAARPQLLIDSDGVPLAWTHALSGKIGRVFLKNPL